MKMTISGIGLEKKTLAQHFLAPKADVIEFA